MLRVTFYFLIVIIISIYAEENVKPLHYNINIEPDFDSLKFYGNVSIFVEVRDPKKPIQIDAKNLKFDQIDCIDTTTNETGCDYIVDPNDFIEINLGLTSLNNMYKIVLIYEGSINEDNSGFYLSKYNKSKGQESKILIADLQYNKAHEVFPCFDDPRFPATFSFSVARPKNYITLFNTAILEQVEKNDLILDIFVKTNAISTYLLSFAIIDFELISKGDDKIYSFTNEDMKYLQEVVPKIKTVLLEKYGSNHNKLDQIIVPDHALSKNVLQAIGLTFYRSSAVSYKPVSSTTQEKQTVLTTITRALAKQWSSNEYFSTSWSYFWMSEGLATLYLLESVDLIEPEWRLLDQFIIQHVHNLLWMDHGDNAITLTYNKALNSNFEDLFNNPQFSIKAGALMRMFRNGNENIGTILQDSSVKSWGDKAGYPLVDAKRDYDNNITVFTQGPIGSDKTIIWPISINMQLNGTTSSMILLSQSANTDEEIFNTSWLLINNEALGYYRTNYDNKNWQKIIDLLLLNHTFLSPINRAQLIDNAAHLFILNKLPSTIYLDLITYIENEEDYIPLSTFFKTTSQLREQLLGTDAYSKFMNITLKLVGKWYERFGATINPAESHIDRLKRIEVLNWMCRFGHETCLKDMFELLCTFQVQHPDLEESIYCGGMINGTLDQFLYLATQYNVNRKASILKGIGCSENEDVLRYYFSAILGNSPILTLSSEEAVRALKFLLQNSNLGVHLTLEVLQNNFNNLKLRFQANQLKTILTSLSKRIHSEEQIEAIDTIIQKLNSNENKDLIKILQKSKSNALEKLSWKDSHVNDIEKWLDERLPTTTTTTTTTTISTTTTTTTKKTTTTTKTTSSTTTTTTTLPTPTTTDSSAVNILLNPTIIILFTTYIFYVV